MFDNQDEKLIDIETVEVNKPGLGPKFLVYSILFVFLVGGVILGIITAEWEYGDIPNYTPANIPAHAKTIQKVLTNIHSAQIKYKEANGKFAPHIAALVDNKFLNVNELDSIVKDGDKVNYFGYDITQVKFTDTSFEATATSTTFTPVKMSINEIGNVTME